MTTQLRGCGTRMHGGVYALLELSPYGRPLEDFMICPPIPVDPEKMGLSPRIPKLFERGGVWHVMDWVGTSNYPNPTDDLEEIRRMGLSARLELRADDYAKLSLESRILRVHSHAYIVDPHPYWKDHQGCTCPKGDPRHTPIAALTAQPEQPEPMCIALLYEDITLARRVEEHRRKVLREMPSFEYFGFRPPDMPSPSQYLPAIYASFPISRIVVVRDSAGGHQEKIDRLKNCRLFDADTGIVED